MNYFCNPLEKMEEIEGKDIYSLDLNVPLYPCEICNKEFSSKGNLKNHYISHNDNRPYSCDLCSNTFKYKCTLQKHKLIHLNEKPFVCEICGLAFILEYKLKSHMIVHDTSTDKIYECDLCGKAFNKRATLKYHEKSIHTPNNLVPCEICNRTFLKSYIKTHYLTHTNDYLFTCDVCHKKLRTKRSLLLHYRIHTDEKPYSCETCNMAFRTTDHLSRHCATHSDERPFKCDICFSTFKLIKHLSTHYYHSHSDKNKQTLTCDVCHKVVRGRHNLKRHMEVHDVNLSTTCKKCQKTVRKRSLRAHMKICGKIKPATNTSANPSQHSSKNNEMLPCEKCPKMLRNRQSLKRHMEIHDINLCVTCNTCQKIIRRRSLPGHQKICGKPKFSNKLTLDNQDKLHQCNFCLEGFSKPQKLVEHIKVHLEDN